MTDIVLTKRETTILTQAAGHDDRLIVLPSSIKHGPAERLLAKFLDQGLAVARDLEGTATHHLAPAGYRALGLKPPRSRRVALVSASPRDVSAAKGSTKRDLVIELLAREEGASLDDIIAATGWLPHTTRAALSRLRSSGRALAKGTREGGTTSYRLLAEPAPVKQAASRVIQAVAANAV